MRRNSNSNTSRPITIKADNQHNSLRVPKSPPTKSNSPTSNLNVSGNMVTSKLTTQPMTEVKQSIAKRVSLKVSPRLKLSRSTSSSATQATSSRYSLTATRRSSFLSSSVNSFDSSDVDRSSIQISTAV